MDFIKPVHYSYEPLIIILIKTFIVTYNTIVFYMLSSADAAQDFYTQRIKAQITQQTKSDLLGNLTHASIQLVCIMHNLHCTSFYVGSNLVGNC